ncbi:hypothetical protein TWF106_011507 [Orbilia oligospora]|uniref:Rhodopsin domain-containing protein n=1 Tax=Orbilia oligospora TaxID=2813651 RepID=A0A7C8Q4F8_ORBOL|nr:hypothetical protein TWF788_000195 [Orbilia oligospora]KAF3208274.1 hypothetical protein TWF106_011507 [Orbilia oligospora]
MEVPKSKANDTDNVNQKADVFGVAIVAVCLVVPTILGRIYVRTRVLYYFGIDDIFMILSGVSVVAAATYSILTVTGGNYGTGQHIFDVSRQELINFFKSVYIWEVGYCVALLFIKLSIITYYNRLQPSRLYLFTLVVIVTGSTSFLLTNILQCWPISAAWDPDALPNASHSDACINDTVFAYCSAAFNIITDFWIWACCVRMLRNLQVAVKKKIEIMTIFSLGLLACGASIARLFTIHNFYGTSDKTWAIVPIMTCSFLELALAIVAACLPTLKPGFSRLSNWAQKQPAWVRTVKFCSKIPTLSGRRRSGGSSMPGRRRSSNASIVAIGVNGKAHSEPGRESPMSRRLSTIKSMVERDNRPNGNHKEPALSEIGRWGLKNNDFCRDLEMQHDLPPAIPERQPERSLSEHYLGSGGLVPKGLP